MGVFYSTYHEGHQQSVHNSSPADESLDSTEAAPALIPMSLPPLQVLVPRKMTMQGAAAPGAHPDLSTGFRESSVTNCPSPD